MQTTEFQGRIFDVHPTEGGGLKVMYLNRTRNIAGSVSARDINRFPQLLGVQARCCRDGDGEDALVPRS